MFLSFLECFDLEFHVLNELGSIVAQNKNSSYDELVVGVLKSMFNLIV